MNIERPNRMRTRQSLPVSGCDGGCDGDGGAGISTRQGILSRACGRLQFKSNNEMRLALDREFFEARLIIAGTS
jgi:hypothetical protein